jgi:protein-disulfide isomerase
VIARVEATTAEAENLGFTGTPSFALEGTGINGVEAIGTPESVDALESAIEDAGE